MDSKFFFIILLSLLVYTLYWTWFNDFGLFLFIALILLTGLFVHKFVNEQIIYFENKIDNVINEIIQNINNIKYNVS